MALLPWDENFLHSHRGVAQPGRALRSGRRGRWFKSSRPDLTGVIMDAVSVSANARFQWSYEYLVAEGVS